MQTQLYRIRKDYKDAKRWFEKLESNGNEKAKKIKRNRKGNEKKIILEMERILWGKYIKVHQK